MTTPPPRGAQRRLCSTFSSARPMSLAVFVSCVLFALIYLTVPVTGKGIYITVQAPWNETALLQEGCEWAARRFGNEGFFNCLEQVWKRQQLMCHGGGGTAGDAAQTRTVPQPDSQPCAVQGARAMTQQAQYTLVKDVIVGMPYVTEDDLNLFAMQMAARFYSPTVEAHYTLSVLDAIHERREDSDEQRLESPAEVSGSSASEGCIGEPFVILLPTVDESVGRNRANHSGGDRGRHGRIITKPSDLAAVLRSVSLDSKESNTSLDATHGVSAPWTMHPVTTLSTQDHEYVRHTVPGGDDDGTREAWLAHRLPTALLYGLVGEAQTLVWYTTLVEAQERSTVGRLIFRHLPVSIHRLCGPRQAPVATEQEQQWQSPLYVPGYGATVDFKSVEYKAVDERQNRDASNEPKSSGVSQHDLVSTAASQRAVLRDEVGGFNIQRLSYRYTNLTTALTIFANTLEEVCWSEVETAVDFRVWELQNMGMAAVQYISEAPPDQRFATLHRLVRRFPLYATRLARIAAEPRRYLHVAREVSKVRAVLKDGVSGLFLDGRYIRVDDLSLFSLLRRIDVEEDLLRSLQRLLIHTPSRAAAEVKEVGSMQPTARYGEGEDDGGSGAALLRAAYKLRKTARAFDGTVIGDVNKTSAEQQDEEEERRMSAVGRVYVAPEHIIWVNDVETDKHFASLPRSLSVILRSTAYGAQHMPRRNLLNLVILFDPTMQEGVYTVLGALNLLRQGITVNIGLVIVDRDWSETFTSELSDTREVRGDSARSLVTSIIAVTMSQLWHGGHKEMIVPYLLRLVQGTERDAAGVLVESAVRTLSEFTLGPVTDLTLDELLADETFTRQYHDTQSTVQQLNLLTLPMMLLNGIPVASIQAFQQEWQAEMAVLRSWVRQGVLKDSDTKLYETILRLHDATTHMQRAFRDARPIFAWDTTALLDFLHRRPFLYPVSATPGSVALISHVVVLPPAARAQATLQLLVPALHSLESCQGYSQLKRTMCEAMRTSIISCPTPRGVAETSGGVAAQLERLVQHVAALPDPRDGVGLVRRYVDVALRATASLSANMSLYDDASAVPESMLPTEMRAAVAETNSRGRRRGVETASREQAILTQHLCQVASERLGLTAQTTAPLLISNGLVVSLDSTFTELDHVLAAQMQYVLANKVRRTLEELDLPALGAAAGRGNSGGNSGRDGIVDTTATQLSSDDLDSTFYAARTAALSSVLGVDATQYTHNMNILSLLPPHKKLPRSTLHITPPAGQLARHRLLAVVDPAERTAQTLVALCDFLLRSPLPVELTLYLNPTADLTRPVRNFYDYVAETALRFDEGTGAVVPPAAIFLGMPAQQLLTLGVEEPEAWTVFAHEAEDDLDNLLLARLPNETRLLPVSYRIQSLLVTGEARDAGSVTGVASGLPLTLRTSERVIAAEGDGGRVAVQTRMHDTIVMVNMGYFQLRAAPGMWWLSLQPGLAETAYQIRAVDGRPVAPAAVGAAPPPWRRRHGATPNHGPGGRVAVLVNSFEGRYLRLDVRHVSGATTVGDILRTAEETTTHTWPPTTQDVTATRTKPAAPTLNVFSVASGHLYERFLRMMMYSVHNASSDKHGANTTRIKFWLLENYLSPQFKAYVPQMAAHYGYEVEFVTYHWPWWLLKQTEKQRKIWAYKILFLDVLFPLDVDRVIFVDADQSMRTDLHELYNMDIDEHAIAMTPFCESNSNKLTEKFRFWRSGFWPKQLQGKPYHISALFLVDLLRFRRLGAGDTYRVTYNQLVPDPKSLANLDQDLPNYLQDYVPIYSLPEEWLWCETWCSAESKSRAKTIDLCNNPLTKIPKLESAKAVIPHWQELDDELERVATAILHLNRNATTSS